MHRIGRIVAVAVAALAVAAALPSVASAHEHRDVANGKYTMIVGFLSEPAIAGLWNGLDLRVSENAAGTPAAGSSGTPVTGLEQTLKVEIIFADQKKELTLEPRYNTPGAYNAYVIPTKPGDYTFHIFGTINGDTIDENFTSSPQGFSSVEDPAQYQFP
jgi:hypothetical protein